jgi:hypothetical protein
MHTQILHDVLHHIKNFHKTDFKTIRENISYVNSMKTILPSKFWLCDFKLHKKHTKLP